MFLSWFMKIPFVNTWRLQQFMDCLNCLGILSFFWVSIHLRYCAWSIVFVNANDALSSAVCPINFALKHCQAVWCWNISWSWNINQIAYTSVCNVIIKLYTVIWNRVYKLELIHKSKSNLKITHVPPMTVKVKSIQYSIHISRKIFNLVNYITSTGVRIRQPS